MLLDRYTYRYYAKVVRRIAMGVSTDAILFYGIAFDDGIEKPWENDEINDGPEEFYAARMGVCLPDVEVDWKNTDNTPEAYEAYKQYWDDKRDVNAASGVEIGYHCSSDYPMLYLAVSATHMCANRGYPKEVDTALVASDCDITAKWDKQLRDFCEIMELEYEQPKWWLVSNWS
jgi:hypothetical protein